MTVEVGREKNCEHSKDMAQASPLPVIPSLHTPWLKICTNGTAQMQPLLYRLFALPFLNLCILQMSQNAECSMLTCSYVKHLNVSDFCI